MKRRTRDRHVGKLVSMFLLTLGMVTIGTCYLEDWRLESLENPDAEQVIAHQSLRFAWIGSGLVLIAVGTLTCYCSAAR